MAATETIKQFSTQCIGVIGDVMLDRYIYGKVERISPEAPIPIVHWNETMLVPGGAGNTAANITALGAQCRLFGITGDDLTRDELIRTLETFNITTDDLIADKRPTTEKTRVLGNHQQIVRIDHELVRPIDDAKTDQLCYALEQHADDYSALLVCDYAKGVVSERLIACARAIAKKRNIPILADVRPEHRDMYRDLSFITPNRKELSGMVGTHIGTVDDAKEQGLSLAQKLNTALIVTMSEEGMLIIDHQSGTMTHLPTRAQQVVDVSGAGDTVIATMTLALAAGASPVEAATIANHAASCVVAKLGTATVNQVELAETFA